MHGREACMAVGDVHGRGHACQGAYVAGWGRAWRGACVVGGSLKFSSCTTLYLDFDDLRGIT